VVRRSSGKVLGLVNTLALQGPGVVDSGKCPLQNFALARVLLVVLAFSKVHTVK
jgi:hypothetical protein